MRASRGWFSLLLLSSSLCVAAEYEPEVIDHSEAIAAADASLAAHQRAMDRLSSFSVETKKLEGMVDGVEQQQKELQASRTRLDDIIREVTSWNIDKLKELELKLRAIESKEEVRRNIVEDAPELPDSISFEDLDSKLSPENLVAETDEMLKGWISGIIDEEAETAIESLQNDFAKFGDHFVYNDTGACVSYSVAANEVENAIVRHARDGIGRYDHARTAKVVHELTSNTYRPPATASQLLGTVWWRQFIPDDWEKQLPKGWEDWDARMPEYFAHTLGLKAPVSPPEAVLQGFSLPGSCWPMEGSSGNMVLSLPYVVDIDSVTVDHAPSMLLIDKVEQLKSAPRNINVYGYAACTGDCNGHDFDQTRRTLITSVVYDIDLGGVQTFEVTTGDAEDAQKEEIAAGGTCSAETASCSAPPQADEGFAAVDFEIVDNWGNAQYTCIYRLRVHGARSDASSEGD